MNDKANGWGVYHKKDENGSGPIIMEGMFKGNKQCGFGRLKVIKEDTVYEGIFLNNVKEGWGVLYWPDDSKVDGFWSRNKLNGLVIFVFLSHLG